MASTFGKIITTDETTRPTWGGLGSNRTPHCEKSATKHLSKLNAVVRIRRSKKTRMDSYNPRVSRLHFVTTCRFRQRIK